MWVSAYIKLLYNLGQNTVDKFTKLSKTGFCNYITAFFDVSQFSSTSDEIWLLVCSPSIPGNFSKCYKTPT